MKKSLRNAEDLISKKDKKAGKAVSSAFSTVDKAVKNNIISSQRAGRIKSRLSKKLDKTKIKIEKREIKKAPPVVKKISKAKKASAKKKSPVKKTVKSVKSKVSSKK